MTAHSTQKKPASPLNNRRLRDLALHYAGRYATTRAKLSTYLERKIRERGWREGEARPDLAALADEFAALGYINDAAYAQARARNFARRGYGAKRLEQELYAAGISDSDAADARNESAANAFASADAFARRKRIGPYAAQQPGPDIKRKQLAAFIRAGHNFDLARKFVEAAMGQDIEDG